MIDLLLSRLNKVRKSGDGYLACCCAHDDKSPSLSITERNGRILLHCHAGCTPDEIISSAGLEWNDLFEDERETSHQRAVSQRQSLGPVDNRRVEENVLLIAQARIKQGRPLSVEDTARVEIALERLGG